MKQIYFLTAIITLFCTKLTAQATDVVSDIISNPYALALSGNNLYISHGNNSSAGHGISKIDLSETNPVATIVTTAVSTATGLVISGNYLYIAEKSANKISKIDITATNPVVTDVITGINAPLQLVLNGNDLYIAESGANKISKIDITANTPVATDVLTGISDLTGLALKGNDLYFNNNFSEHFQKISKIDITATNPIATDVFTLMRYNNVHYLTISGNDLYITEKSPYNGNKISKSDVTVQTPTAINVVAGLDINGTIIIGNDLYFANLNTDSGVYNRKISKIDTSATYPNSITVTGTCIDTYASGTYSESNFYNGKITYKKGPVTNELPCEGTDNENVCNSPKKHTIRWDGSKWEWFSEPLDRGCVWESTYCSTNFKIANTKSKTLLATSSDNTLLPPCNGWVAEAGGCVPSITGCETLNSIQNTFSNNITITPNPTNGYVSINLGIVNKAVTVILTNLMGQVISTKVFYKTSSLEFNIDQPAGMYFVRITGEKGVKAELKVLKN